jgi:dermatan/chondrotin sulfate uronyl 2-O-sulfotransferase UST
MTRVVYNRIAKAGSTALTSLLLALSNVNNFTVYNDDRTHPSSAYLQERLRSFQNDTIYINHCNYVNDLPEDYVWINMMREPIDRAQSNFYYRFSPQRGPERIGKQKALEKKDPCNCIYDEFDACIKKLNKPYSKCAGSLAFERSKTEPTIISYFGPPAVQGSETPVPYFSGLEAFERIYQKYLFVGLTEEFQLSLQVLEKLLPRFFKGALELFLEMEHASEQKRKKVGFSDNASAQHNKMTKTQNAGAVSTETREILEKNNVEEVDLYRRTKMLFWNKVNKIIPEAFTYESIVAH